MTWTGAQLYKSIDSGSNYAPLLSSTNAATIGTAAGVLGDFADGNVFDYDNSVSIILRSGGPLVSYTELQVLNGEGLCVLGTIDKWEVLQFKTATLTAPNTYTLRGLLRGRRGTEWAMGLHAAGDTFVLASLVALKRNNPGTSEIGLSRQYKAVSSGAALSDVLAQSFTNSAVSLECYSPVHLSGVRDGSNNLSISWIRRTRLGGEWRDYVDVLNGEPTLLFDVEIWNSSYTTLLRTFSNLTGVTAAYTAVEQTTDGGTPGDPVYVRVYQLSATVGRGYKLQGTI